MEDIVFRHLASESRVDPAADHADIQRAALKTSAVRLGLEHGAQLGWGRVRNRRPPRIFIGRPGCWREHALRPEKSERSDYETSPGPTKDMQRLESRHASPVTNRATNLDARRIQECQSFNHPCCIDNVCDNRKRLELPRSHAGGKFWKGDAPTRHHRTQSRSRTDGDLIHVAEAPRFCTTINTARRSAPQHKESRHDKSRVHANMITSERSRGSPTADHPGVRRVTSTLRSAGFASQLAGPPSPSRFRSPRARATPHQEELTPLTGVTTVST